MQREQLAKSKGVGTLKEQQHNAFVLRAQLLQWNHNGEGSAYGTKQGGLAVGRAV